MLVSLLLAAPGWASASGRLTIVTHGLPAGVHPVIVVRGHGVKRTLRSARVTLHGLRHGRYRLRYQRVRVTAGSKAARAGATAYPAKRLLTVTVHSHHTARAAGAYSVVNPKTRAAPSHIKRVLGDPTSPQGIVLGRRGTAPTVGTILTSGPSPQLPAGMLAEVTGVSAQGGSVTVALQPADIADAVPQLSFSGDLRLAVAPNAPDSITADAARVRGRAAAASCKPPKLLTFSAHLDSVSVREASLGAWPPQMRLTLAARTTEHLGVALAAVGINCDFDLGEIGPFQGAIQWVPLSYRSTPRSRSRLGSTSPAR
jgi:hypothetical protein